MRAGWDQGTAAGRQGEEARPSREQVPVLMAADRSRTTVSAVLPRVDAAALALDPVVAKTPCWSPTGGASYPPFGVTRSTQPLDGGTGSGRLHVQTVNTSLKGAAAAIATRYQLVPPRRTSPPISVLTRSPPP